MKSPPIKQQPMPYAKHTASSLRSTRLLSGLGACVLAFFLLYVTHACTIKRLLIGTTGGPRHILHGG
jgi:hypothetical protein